MKQATFPRDWGRLLTAMATPFDANGGLDEASTRRLAAVLVDQQKNDGLVISGTTGESPTLTDDEKLQVLAWVLDEVGDRAAVVFGSGSNNTAHSVELTERASAAGAHGIMAVNPYYNKPDQAGLEAHFRAIAASTDLPVMLYNIQPRSAVNLETETLLHLAEVDNIVAVKEASGNMAQIVEVCGRVPDGFRVYSGDDMLTLPLISSGGYGLVSVSAHVAGQQLKKLIEATLSANLAEAQSIMRPLVPLIQAVFSAPSPVPVKTMLAEQGLIGDAVRLPLVLRKGEARAEIVEALARFQNSVQMVTA